MALRGDRPRAPRAVSSPLLEVQVDNDLTGGMQSSAYSNTPNVATRVASIASHLDKPAMPKRLKVVVTRDLGSDVMPLLLNNPEFDVQIVDVDVAPSNSRLTGFVLDTGCCLA